VRFLAVRGKGLLQPEEARAAFLSADSSLKLKKFLLKSPSLLVDKEVLDHAWQIFGEKDKQRCWGLLVHGATRGTLTEELFENWINEHDGMSAWMEREGGKGLLGLAQLAQRFPNTMVRMVEKGIFEYAWYWAKDILAKSPILVLRSVLVFHAEGIGPKKGYDPLDRHQNFHDTLASWGWRHKPELMLEICNDMMELDTSRGADDLIGLAKILMSVTSTRYYLTLNAKLKLLRDMWEQVPDARKEDNEELACQFVTLIPNGAEVSRIVDACWMFAGGVGRASRQKLLVGEEKSLKLTKFLKTFASKLPPDEAVAQFLQVLKEYDASQDTYQHFQSSVCVSKDGKHDELMRIVFAKYLEIVEGDDAAVKAAKLFQQLEQDAKSRDVIQSSFDLLLEFLGEKMEPKLFAQVVARMGRLEKQSREKDSVIPPATLPIPVTWVRLVKLQDAAPPHAAFLLQVLRSGTGERDLLGAMMAHYGQRFFWDVLAHVLQYGEGQELLDIKPPLVPNFDALKEIDVSSIPRASSEEPTGGSRRILRRGSTETFSQYFSSMGDAKKKVNSKAPCDREAGYLELIKLCVKDNESAKAWNDLLPYLLQRFGAEQEAQRGVIVRGILTSLKTEMWHDVLKHLKNLWKLCAKARESANYSQAWVDGGRAVVKMELQKWPATAPGAAVEVSELCEFGLEVSKCEDNLPGMLVDCCKAKDQPLEGVAFESALGWVLQTAVPLTSEVGLPLSSFWAALDKLCDCGKGDKWSARDLWERYPCVSTHWRKLLEQGANQKNAEFILVKVLDLLRSSQSKFAPKGSNPALVPQGKKSPCRGAKPLAIGYWWEPLECAEYKAAVRALFGQMESGELPPKEASELLARRVEALALRAMHRAPPPGKTDKAYHDDLSRREPEWMTRPRRRRLRCEKLKESQEEGGSTRLPCRSWVNLQQWDLPRHHRSQPLPWSMYHIRDSVAAEEVRTLAKLLPQGGRQVMWQIVEVASWVAGPEISNVIGAAIAKLDPKFEGMARCIARHYPYLNSAMTKGEQLTGSSDLLTPLLELWLLEDGPRDERVAELMKRNDVEYLLFFGTSFSRHLSNARQEWLHTCLQKLRAPDSQAPEFYHYTRRGPILRQIAQLRGGSKKGFRHMLNTPEGLSSDGFPIAVQMYLWHPETQTEFLEKGLQSTDSTSLALIPRAEHADSVAFVRQVLDRYPCEQSVKEAADIWGWEVIQAAGAYSNLHSEVERRFSQLQPPPAVDAVDDMQVEALLTALGRADDAAKALKVLGAYAGKVKQAKEAVTKMIAQVSPPRARNLLRDVMLARKSGVGLQIAGLNMIVDLRIPNPLELYRATWRKGFCQRDVAAKILAKVTTSPQFAAEDIQEFFDTLQKVDVDKRAYIADALLDELIAQPEWAAPFLPEVVGNFAMLNGLTSKAVTALLGTNANPTEVLKALCQVIRVSRLASRTPPEKKSGGKVTLLKDLGAVAKVDSCRRQLADLASKAKIDESDPAALLAYIDEALQTWEEAEMEKRKVGEVVVHESGFLDMVLQLWSKLLRTSGTSDEWLNTMLHMYRTLGGMPGFPLSLDNLARWVTARALALDFGPKAYDSFLQVIGTFFCRLLDEALKVEDDDKERAKAGDEGYRKMSNLARSTGHKLLFNRWADLLAHGCAESETAVLLALCPEDQKLELAKGLVTKAVEIEKQSRDVSMCSGGGPRQQRRPDEGWKHEGGIPVQDVKVGSKVSGVVTNSSFSFGVFVNFGCVKDGKIAVPVGDWNKYRVGDRVENLVVNRVSKSQTTGNDFIELLIAGTSAPSSGQAAYGGPLEVARRAVRWLALPVELRSARWGTLARLWASIVALDLSSNEFKDHLSLFGSGEVTPAQAVRLVEELLVCNPPNCIARKALQWLAGLAPSDAVRLWPELLKPSAISNAELERLEADLGQGSGVKEDIEMLVKMCIDGGHKLPPIRAYVAKGLSDEVLEFLLRSPLDEARLLAVQALQERAYKQQANEPPAQLKALKADSCAVVSLAAKLLWEELGGEPDQPETEQEGEEDEDDEETKA